MRRYHKVASKGKLYLTTRDSIEEAEYQEDESIRELFVEDGVQEVGENAFLKCKNLRTVFLPDSLQEINADVFGFCENLEEVRLGNRVQYIGAGAFFNCRKLKEIRLPDTLQSLDVCAFADCTELREVVIPEGVVSIEGECFSNCTSLQRVSLPASVQWIGVGAFSCCGDHMDLQVHPDNPYFSAKNGCLLSKDGKTLYGCTAKDGAVSVPDGVVEIGERAFGDSKIAQVHLPEGVRRIGAMAFIFCHELHHIDLPNGLTSIGETAFRDSGIEELVLPESVEQIGEDALSVRRIRYLAILGSKAMVPTVCEADDLQPDAMLMADHLEIEDYPEPFTALHGLRSVAARWRAGERVPDTVMERFRKYLTTHYKDHWEDPNIFSLIVALRLLPKKSMERATRRAIELNDPATTAALLQYQHEMFSQEQAAQQQQKRVHGA